MIVLSDIITAPIADVITIPKPLRTPTAKGMATMLYSAAQTKFWIIFREVVLIT